MVQYISINMHKMVLQGNCPIVALPIQEKTQKALLATK